MRGREYGTVVVDPYLTGGVHDDDAALLDTIRLLQPRAAILILTGYGSAAMIHAAAADEGTTLLFKPQPAAYLSQWIADASAPRMSLKGRTR